jgi:hypothetical protein
MGHFHETVRGIGKDRAEAVRNGIDDFMRENGTRHSVRDTSKFKLLRKVPPERMVEEVIGGRKYLTNKPDESAPKREWLEEWEFELHTHA